VASNDQRAVAKPVCFRQHLQGVALEVEKHGVIRRVVDHNAIALAEAPDVIGTKAQCSACWM